MNNRTRNRAVEPFRAPLERGIVAALLAPHSKDIRFHGGAGFGRSLTAGRYLGFRKGIDGKTVGIYVRLGLEGAHQHQIIKVRGDARGRMEVVHFLPPREHEGTMEWKLLQLVREIAAGTNVAAHQRAYVIQRAWRKAFDTHPERSALHRTVALRRGSYDRQANEVRAGVTVSPGNGVRSPRTVRPLFRTYTEGGKGVLRRTASRGSARASPSRRSPSPPAKRRRVASPNGRRT